MGSEMCIRDSAIVVDKGLTKIRDGDGPENIFLIPPAGCSLVYFKPLTEFLNPRFNVYSIDSYESIHWDSIETYAGFIAKSMISIQPSGPWLIVGACFGNHIVLEIAAQLPPQPQKPASESHLYLIDSSPPLNGPGWSCDAYKEIARMNSRKKNTLAIYWRKLVQNYQLDRFKSLAHRQKRRLIGLVNSDVRKYNRVRVIQGRTFTTYRSRPVATGITLILSREYAQKEEEIERWRSLTLGNFNCHCTDALTHYDLVNKRSPYWRHIAQIFNKTIQQESSDNESNNSLDRHNHSAKISCEK